MATVIIPKYMPVTDSGWQRIEGNLDDPNAAFYGKDSNNNPISAYIYYRKYGNLLTVTGSGLYLRSYINAGSYVKLFSLPEGFRPGSYEFYPTVFINNSNAYDRIAAARLAWNGDLYLYASKSQAFDNSWVFYIQGIAMIS